MSKKKDAKSVNIEKENNVDVELFVEEVETNTKEVDIEKEDMKKKIEQLEEMVKAMVNSQSNTNVQIIDTSSKMDKPCTLIHLIDTPQGLPTTINVNGVDYEFNSFGERKLFRFSDMQTIMGKFKKFFDRGIFALGEDCGDIGSTFGIKNVTILPVEKYKNLASMSFDDFSDVLALLDDAQKVHLAKSWVIKYNQGIKEYKDVNKIMLLNKGSGGFLNTILENEIKKG